MLFAADVLDAQPGRDDHLRRQVHAATCRRMILRHGGSPLMWKTGHSLIKAKMRETERRARRRDERPLLLRRALVRLRRRHLRRRAAARDPRRERRVAERSSSTRCRTACRTPEIKVDAPRASTHAFVERFRAAREVRGRARRRPSTGCASTGRTAGAWCARRTRRRCWCCASTPIAGRAGAHPGGVPRTAARARAGPAAAVLALPARGLPALAGGRARVSGTAGIRGLGSSSRTRARASSGRSASVRWQGVRRQAKHVPEVARGWKRGCAPRTQPSNRGMPCASRSSTTASSWMRWRMSRPGSSTTGSPRDARSALA